MDQKVNRCIIIGAGDMALSAIAVKEEDFIIAVDGGYHYCKLLKIEPDFVIGDFDSVEENERMEIAELKRINPNKVCELPCEKDDTDMRAALKYALKGGYRDFRIYGAMGGRIEHTFANFQCLFYIKKHGGKGFLMENDCMITVIKDESFRLQEGRKGMVSVFSMGEKAEGVSIRGMKYPLDSVVLTNDFPIGISNEFTDEAGEIMVENGTLLIMVRW